MHYLGIGSENMPRDARHYLNANPDAVDILRVLSKHNDVWFTTGQISYALHNAEPGRVGAYLKKLYEDGLILAGYREADCHIHKRIRVWKMGSIGQKPCISTWMKRKNERNVSKRYSHI